MNSEAKNKTCDDWELHPLFLSKIPTKQDIDKHAALSALISIINEEEEQESFRYEPRRKNLNKKITDTGEVIRKRDRRNMYEPYQSIANRNLGLKKSLGGRLLYNRPVTTNTTTVKNYNNSCNINNYNNSNICNSTYTYSGTKEEMGQVVNDGINASNGNGNENENENYGVNNNNNSSDNNENEDAEAKTKRATETSVGELVVCMSMLNLK